MDDFLLGLPQGKAISCVEMHTSGEPTRIVYKGYPELNGSLLEQRAQAKREHDHVRRRLMLEPRGHFDMYGAILRPDTELTRSGQAHMGVLFLTNDGYSTMCGHATIALGRLLVDCHDLSVFPKRSEVVHDPQKNTAALNLHAPCGLIEVTVPTIADGSKADPSRPVSFISVPSFATGIDIAVPLPEAFRWSALGEKTEIVADFAYGGAFFCFADAASLGFNDGLRNTGDFSQMQEAAALLKSVINHNKDLHHLFTHPDHQELGFLYSIIIVDKSVGSTSLGSNTAETGLCFFADSQVDRSPTGSGVAARVALAAVKPDAAGMMLKSNDRRTYHSLVSNSWTDSSKGGFAGSWVAEDSAGESKGQYPSYRVRVEGHAYYTGYSTFVVDEHDPLQDDGFVFRHLARGDGK